jgi:uncharacterized protein YeaO (DUF488 family)
MIKVKRIYDSSHEQDGYRVLVDRVWPRGVSKEKANLDLWLKEIAPSEELRKWFNHDQEKWEEFKKRYREELAGKQELLDQLRGLENQHKKVTLLYGAKDEEHNQAIILVSLLG